MPHRTSKARCALLYCSVFDILFSTALISGVAYYVATCEVEDESIVDRNITLEQIEYFYKALEDCGYREENDIPSTAKICTSLENNVMPWAGLALSLNFVIAVYIQIMVHDSHFFLDKEYHNHTRKVSLVYIPIGILVDMSLGIITLVEYTKPEMCWLAYSILKQRKTYPFWFAIFGIPVVLAVYKPFELSIFYLYGCSLFPTDAEDIKTRKSINQYIQAKASARSVKTKDKIKIQSSESEVGAAIQ